MLFWENYSFAQVFDGSHVILLGVAKETYKDYEEDG